MLKYALEDPNFYGVLFRRTLKQIERTLWKEAKEMYKPFLYNPDGSLKAGARIQEQKYKITFPYKGRAGAVIEFSYAENEKDIELNWQGAEVTYIGIDEATHFTEWMINYLRTRLRSKAKVNSFIRLSLNPSPGSWVLKYIMPYLLPSGIADNELSGKPRYFIFLKGELHTAWTKEELRKRFPDCNPRTYTFIKSSLTDNPIMLENNKSYADDLENSDPQNAAMLLDGNWLYQPAANGIFNRFQLKKIAKRPLNTKSVRAWDKASSTPDIEGKSSYARDPDYTASVKMEKDSEGNIYLVGDYVRDKDGLQKGKFREKTAQREESILAQSVSDGEDTMIILPQDPGQAGVFEFTESSKALLAEGFIVKKDPSVFNKSKRLRFEPFVAACGAGIVHIVESTFDKDVLDALYNELENFDGDKNNGYHDDWVDATSSAYAALLRERTIPTPVLPSSSQSTKSRLDTLRSEVGRTSTVGTPQSYNMNKNLNK